MMGAELALTNCQVVTPRGRFPATIYIGGGVITKITREIEERPPEVIDAGGLPVLPGLIDGHVHMMDPGHTECEDFTLGTKAAARAGVTTVLEHPRTVPPVYDVKTLREKRDYLSRKAVVDFGLFVGILPENLEEAPRMWEAGAIGFKVFTVEVHETPSLGPGDFMALLRNISSFGGVVLVHAEDDSIVKRNEARLKASGRKDYMLHTEMHTPEAQELAVETLCYLASRTLSGTAKLVVAHVSDPACLKRVAERRLQGVNIFAETMPHYLYLTYKDLEEKGPFVKFTPTVRSPEVVAEMWRCLNRGLIHNVSTDHAPQPRELIEKGIGDIWRSPLVTGANIEVGSRLMFNAVNEGKTSLEKVAELMAEGPARIYGLWPKKGTIQVGADADLVVVDLEREETISPDWVVSKGGWTMYDGKTLKGAPLMTFLRGKLVYREGDIMGEAGGGSFVTRP